MIGNYWWSIYVLYTHIFLGLNSMLLHIYYAGKGSTTTKTTMEQHIITAAINIVLTALLYIGFV